MEKLRRFNDPYLSETCEGNHFASDNTLEILDPVDEKDLLSSFLHFKMHREFKVPWLLSLKLASRFDNLESVTFETIRKLVGSLKIDGRYKLAVREAFDSIDHNLSLSENYILSLVITEITRRIEVIAG